MTANADTRRVYFRGGSKHGAKELLSGNLEPGHMQHDDRPDDPDGEQYVVTDQVVVEDGEECLLLIYRGKNKNLPPTS